MEINDMEYAENENGFYMEAKDGKKLFLYCFDNVAEPKAVVQIFHGMAEHAGRYKDFAAYLNSKGFIVYGDDHRGHGKTAKSIDQVGYIGEDGFNKIVEDKYMIKNWIKSKHPNLPIIVFSHSFGSFIGQEFILQHGNEIDGIILSGSAARTRSEILAGRIVSSFERKVLGESRKSKLSDYFSFLSCNKKIKNPVTKSDWLTRDNNEVKKFREDPFCGTVFTIGFYYYLFKGFSRLYDKDRLAQIPKDLPIMIMSGTADPIGRYGKLVNNLHLNYLNAGVKNLSIKLYPEARHELINEINKHEVYEDILEWLTELLNK